MTLKAAGHDLSTFQITGNDMIEETYGGGRHAQSTLLQARIDAVLIYFRIVADPEDEGPVKARIGFVTPQA